MTTCSLEAKRKASVEEGVKCLHNCLMRCDMKQVVEDLSKYSKRQFTHQVINFTHHYEVDELASVLLEVVYIVDIVLHKYIIDSNRIFMIKFSFTNEKIIEDSFMF